MKIILALLQAFLCLISSLSVQNSAFKFNNDRRAIDLTSTSEFTFDTITADELTVTKSEKDRCRNWFDENIVNAGINGKAPAYDFTVKGKSLRNNLSDWTFSKSDESETGAVRAGGKTTYITLTHMKSGLTAKVEATIYEDNATCEWTVYIKNGADTDSPVIKDFYAADTVLDIGTAEMYVSRGSRPDNDDFTLLKSFCTRTGMNFSANGGRSGSFLPYFNFSGEDCGCVMTTGWTGQWFTAVKQKSNGLAVKAKQENFKAYLEPGEEIRSPLVSLTFYENKNPLKGFNTFRNWLTSCVCPENVGPMNGFVIANEFSKLTTDDFINMINNIPAEVLDNTDYFWMDAGWYKYNEGWHDGVGNWTADTDRFPEGLKPLSDAIKEKGKRFLLWFEPERVRENTILYNEAMLHNTWIVQNGSDLLWNLGDKNAAEFLSKYISDCLNDNGITIYRQDFNFDPLEYWQKADREFYSGRTGICENHYVTNLYAYIDYLTANTDGLIIDNCASGGKRIDIEMTRRSLPLWRSDYNCGNADGTVKEDVLEATQSMTYGLSFWVPYSGTNRYFHSEYAARSAILTDQSVYEPDPYQYSAYQEVSELMGKTYYPLTFGGLDLTQFHAMQFDDGTGSHGAALIYKRERVSTDKYILILNGLVPDASYEIYDFDSPGEKSTLTGDELMTAGIGLHITDTPKAVIVMYNKL